MILYDEREECFSVEGRRNSMESLSSDEVSVSNADYPLGLSYHPLEDYATFVQNDPKFVHYRESIYTWLITVCCTLSP